MSLPLLDSRNPASFARKEGNTHLGGTVFAQHQNQQRKIPHPFCFYVAYPDDDSGTLHEVSARKLAAIIGDGGTSRHFSKVELARTLERLDPVMNLAKLLPHLKP